MTLNRTPILGQYINDLFKYCFEAKSYLEHPLVKKRAKAVGLKVELGRDLVRLVLLELQIVEADLLQREETHELLHRVLLFGLLGLFGEQVSEHLFAGLALMQAEASVRVEFVVRTLPCAAETRVNTGRGSLETLGALVHVQRVARVHDVAVSAAGGQLGEGRLHGEVAATRGLADLAATVGTRGLLVFEARVGEQMSETPGAH